MSNSDFQDDNEGSEVGDNFAGVSFTARLASPSFKLVFCAKDYIGGISENGKRHGHGMSLLPNRDQYEGEFR